MCPRFCRRSRFGFGNTVSLTFRLSSAVTDIHVLIGVTPAGPFLPFRLFTCIGEGHVYSALVMVVLISRELFVTRG